MVSPRKRVLADRPRSRRIGSKLGAVKLAPNANLPESHSPCAERKGYSEVQLVEGVAQPSSKPQQATAPAASVSRSAGDAEAISDWSTASFGFEGPARSSPAGRSAPHARQGEQRRAASRSHGTRSSKGSDGGDLLRQVQHGFKALLEVEAYGGDADDERPVRRAGQQSPEPSLVNKGLDAFSAVSRAAVGVATSLDAAIEQLMDQHGWTDRAHARAAAISASNSSTDSGLVGNVEAFFADLAGGGSHPAVTPDNPEGWFDDCNVGGLSFGSHAAASAAESPRPLQKSSSGGSHSSVATAIATKGGIAALLPGLADAFSPADPVDYITEVWGSNFGSILGGGESDDGVAADVAAAAEVARRAEQQQATARAQARSAAAAKKPSNSTGSSGHVLQQSQAQGGRQECGDDFVVSPTANKENQASGGGGAQGVADDWEQFLSGNAAAPVPSKAKPPCTPPAAAAAKVQAATQSVPPQHSSGLANSLNSATGGGSDSKQQALADDSVQAAGKPATEEAATEQQQHWQPDTPQQMERHAWPAVDTPASPQQAATPVKADAGSWHREEHVSAQTAQLASEMAAEAPTPAQPPVRTSATLGCARSQQSSCVVTPQRLSRSSTAPPSPASGADPLTEQVRSQLEALLAEKAHLAAENARLVAENCSLQELLAYTMGQGRPGCRGGGDDCSDAMSEWSNMEDYMEECGLPSVENGVSPVKMLRSRGCSPFKPAARKLDLGRMEPAAAAADEIPVLE